MRIWVVGTSGSGKTTFARQAAARLGIPHVEADAINFTPAWADFNNNDRPEFLRRIGAATAGDAWICDGNYSLQDILLPRITDLIWLDYSRQRVMAQVLRRSLARAIDQKELWPGCREGWRDWLRADHPIRWAWSTHADRRKRYEDIFSGPGLDHVTIRRLTGPSEAENCLRTLEAEQAAAPQ